jgi:hypothetical protein
MPCNQRAQSTRGNLRRTLRQRAMHKKLIRIGHTYVGYAKSVEEAARINAHIKGRLHEFKQGQQARAHLESLSPR